MKNNFKNFVLLCASLLFCIGIAELIIKLFLPQKLIYNANVIYKTDNTFGWRHVENVFTEINPTGVGLVHFRTDSNGYRININDDKIKNEKNLLNILVLGDSFLAAVQVENEKTIPELLKHDLKSNFNLNVNFHNSAVGGWDPNHYFLETKKVLQENKIDLDLCLVFLCVSNDIVRTINSSYDPEQVAQKHHFKIPENFSWSSFINSILYPINDWLEVRSHLFILLKNRFQFILSKMGLTAAYFPEIFLINEQFSNRWEITSVFAKILIMNLNNEISLHFLFYYLVSINAMKIYFIITSKTLKYH